MPKSFTVTTDKSLEHLFAVALVEIAKAMGAKGDRVTLEYWLDENRKDCAFDDRCQKKLREFLYSTARGE